MLLETKRLKIRYIKETDWLFIRNIWADLEQSHYAQYDTPKSTEERFVRVQISRWAQANGAEHMFFAVCLGEEVIGFFSFNKRSVGYEIGYGFHSRFHGKGYAKEALLAIIDHLAGQGIRHFSAGTALKNLPSVGLLRSVGFECVGNEKVSFCKDTEGRPVFFDGGIFELEILRE